MNGDEKEIWVACLWMTSFGTAFWLGWGIGDSSIWISVLLLCPIFLAGIFTAWLFRLAYLAGRGSR